VLLTMAAVHICVLLTLAVEVITALVPHITSCHLITLPVQVCVLVCWLFHHGVFVLPGNISHAYGHFIVLLSMCLDVFV